MPRKLYNLPLFLVHATNELSYVFCWALRWNVCSFSRSDERLFQHRRPLAKKTDEGLIYLFTISSAWAK